MTSLPPPRFLYGDGCSVLQDSGHRVKVVHGGDVLSLRLGRLDPRADRWLVKASANRLTVMPMTAGFQSLQRFGEAAPPPSAALDWLARLGARTVSTSIKQPGRSQVEPLPAVGLLDADADLISEALLHLGQGLAFDLAPGEPVTLLWHPWVIPRWESREHLSARHHVDEDAFAAQIRQVCQQQPGGGCSCTERHLLPDGSVVEHGFPMATGWRWLARRNQYRDQFDADLPNWTAVLHPFTRGSLVQLALGQMRPIPAESPLDF